VRRILLCLTSAGLLATAAPALGATVTLEVAPASVHAGSPVTVTGSAGTGCARGDHVTLISHAFPATHEFAGVPAVFALPGAGGRFAARVRIPPGRAAGAYLITGRCGGGNLGVAARLRVLGRAGVSAALHVVPARVRAGSSVTVTGSVGAGCARGEHVTLISHAFPATHEFAGVAAVFALPGAGGRFATRVRIPPGRAAGDYLITGRCGGGNLGVVARLRVLAGAGRTGGPPTP